MYTSDTPFSYSIGQKSGARIVTWLQRVLDTITQDSERRGLTIFSAQWRLDGRVARELDDDTGAPIFGDKMEGEWGAHYPFAKMAAELLSIGRAYGDHEFLNYGRSVGRKADSKIYVFIIRKVAISVIFDEAHI